MTSILRQESFLSLLLIIIYNDIDDRIVFTTLKYAYDAKFITNAVQGIDVQMFREHLHQMGDQSNKWQLRINLTKYQCFQPVSKGQRFLYI